MRAFAWDYASAIGQDSHRFVNDQELADEPDRLLILGGVMLTGERPLAGNSDADVLLHALTNAISAIAVVGSIIIAGEQKTGLSTTLGAVAVFASVTNIVSGFLITDRMLKMFKEKK